MSEKDDEKRLWTEDEAIAEGARYAGLDGSQLGYVRAYLHEPRSAWFFCCSSACDPCVRTIARAVDRTRELLGLPIEI